MEPELASHCGQSGDCEMGVINVGSRDSELALKQTNLVLDKLKQFYENNPDQLKLNYCNDGQLQFKVMSMKTIGDRILDKPLPDIGTKSLFTKELEVALLNGKVDFIVHSLKDLPTTLPKGCVIGAILKRDDPDDIIVLKESLRSKVRPFDLLLGRVKNQTTDTFKIGTSSQRRIAMIKRCNPNLICVDIRGNLNTRLAKLDKDDGEYAAIILAKAGLDRMGWSDRASQSLRPHEDHDLVDWHYAVGQGAMAVECREDDQRILDLLSPIVDFKTTFECLAERSLMKKLEGGCSVPLGVRSTWVDGDKMLNLESILLSKDGQTVYKASEKTDLCCNKQPGESYEDKARKLNCMTTGITLSNKAMSCPDIRHNLFKTSELGLKVANKMIDAGCLGIMR